jgi:hypothetical protein
MAVVQRDGAGGFEIAFRRRIQTCPESLPRQAYHAVAEEGFPRTIVEEVSAAARQLAGEALTAARVEAPSLAAAGIAMGRTAVPADPDRVLSSHMLLHAAEGEMYRDALSEAADTAGLRVVRFLNKEVRSEAAAALRWQLEQLDEWLAAAGKALGAPWTKDEKDASAAAMLALATINSR